jgi:multiple sugar transport system permease protein
MTAATTAARGPAGVAGRSRDSRVGRRRDPSKARWWVTLAMVSPFLIGLAAFVVYPVCATLYYSLTNFQEGSYRPVKFVGLQNYVDLLTQSDTFWIAVRNTLWMVIIMVPLRTLFALFAAWSISRIKSGAHFYRTLFFVPAIVPVVGAALAFIVMLNPEGPVNSMLARIGITGPGWFSDPNWAKPSLLIMALWAAGDTIVIFSAAMLDVPKELYEAADLDGVNSRQRFWHVTMPFLSPVMVFAIVTGMIYTFQYFTEAFVASGSASSIQSSSDLLGYPGQSLLFYSTELYQQGFVYFKTGYASAMAWILFVVIFVSTIGFLRLSKRWVYAAGDN